MRKLMWFTVGFTAACVAGVYLVNGNWLLLLAFAGLLGMIGLLFAGTKRCTVAAMVMLGCTVGFLWLFGFDSLYLSNARSWDGKTVNTSVEITDYSYNPGYGAAADGIIRLEKQSYRVRLYVNDADSLKPGDRVDGELLLRYTADGGQKTPTYHQGKGIFLLAYGRSETTLLTQCPEVPAKYFVPVLRQRIIGILRDTFPEDTLPFARALLLGDSSLLDYKTETDFMVSGIRHVIAVSGLHISILFSVVYLLAGKRRGLTALLGIPVLVLFAAVAGFTPSIVRATVMQILVILALLLKQEYDPPTALSFAVLVMLLLNPLTISSVSFQLSVGCMVGIFLFARRIQAYLLHEKRFGPAGGKSLRARLTRWIVGSVSVMLSAMAVTTPLCAYYFGMVSLVGMLTNLLTLWVISFIFYGIMAACIAGAIWLPLGRLIGCLISWPIRYVLGTAHLLGAFPLAAVYTESVYIVSWIVFCYVLFALLLRSRQKHPVVLSACALASLILALALSWLEPKQNTFSMTVLDVGQGQCILLQNREKYYMVDCGGEYDGDAADAAAQVLLSRGITRLNGMILTHYDRDHIGGVLPFLSRIKTDALYLPKTAEPSDLKDTLAERYADKIQWLEPEESYAIPQADITLITTQIGRNANESSLCVLFQPENCVILMTGDRGDTGERALLQQTELPKVDVLVVGHHGAKDAACAEFLEAVKPSIAVISVGAENSYGHPDSEVLIRLMQAGAQVLRTDLDGTIIIRG